MDTALTQKFSFILDRNLAKANCTGNRVCTSCDTVVLALAYNEFFASGFFFFIFFFVNGVAQLHVQSSASENIFPA